LHAFEKGNLIRKFHHVFLSRVRERRISIMSIANLGNPVKAGMRRKVALTLTLSRVREREIAPPVLFAHEICGLKSFE
jgi:hypothetical protein